jgi:hypothetical protein
MEADQKISTQIIQQVTRFKITLEEIISEDCDCDVNIKYMKCTMPKERTDFETHKP